MQPKSYDSRPPTLSRGTTVACCFTNMEFDIYTPSGTTSNSLYYWEHTYYIKYGIRINLPLPD